MYDNKLFHFGIKGMKWGIRRYQNKDGSLTDEGRRRLGIKEYEDAHNTDMVIKKGTTASRVVSTSRYEEYGDPEIGGSKQIQKKYVKDTLDADRKLEQKYLSVDGVKNSGRENGKDFYLNWFTNGGYEPDNAQVTMYKLKKDAKIASGKQVVDALIEEAGDVKITDMLKNDRDLSSLAMDYTTDRDLFNKINKRFIDKGYDGVEDINDPDTDMPIIMFNSSKNLGDPIYVQSGRKAIEEYLKKHKDEKV